MSNLLVIKGANIGMRYDLEKRSTIGRSAENTIQLLDPNVSRVHCEIVQRGLSYYIHDLDSKNGVIVNGELIEQKTLLRNDEVVIGGTAFLFNTDHDLKNTRFSNKRVYFTSPTDETISPLEDRSSALENNTTEAPPESRANLRLLLAHLDSLFAFSGLSFPDALERLQKILLRIFDARKGCLMKWDPISTDFVPLVAVSEFDEFPISMNVVRTVIEEKRAVLLPVRRMDPETANILRLEERDDDSGEAAALCVPMFKPEDAATPQQRQLAEARQDRQIYGLLYLEIPKANSLILHDVQMLQSVANLTQVALEHYEALDGLSRARDVAKVQEKRLIGRSQGFQNVMDLVSKVAQVDSTVLITGETGTGKEMIAREIHRRSGRAKYPMVAINCAAIPAALIESELFGHEKGAFTGADRMRRGLIESAHGGILFLDEIGEMALETQTKLLRFLQDHVITRVGGNKPIPVDVRVIAATNAKLEEAVGRKEFRQDLWYRLNVFSIHIPPLRDRKRDIQPLAEFFVENYAKRYNKPLLTLPDRTVHFLETYHWPGNVRELQNAIERAVLLSDLNVLDVEHFSLGSTEPGAAATTVGGRDETLTIRKPISLAEAERDCILNALRACEWNQVKAASLLEIHRNTLRKKIKDLGLREEDEEE
ncbi:MAG: sigma 54-interacting transcriptional regulator [Candidatus Sumerlaeota bacterium]